MILVGIDSGASKTEILADIDGQEWHAIVPGGINYQRLGLNQTVEKTAAAVSRLLAEIPVGRKAVVCIGLAGADEANDRDRVAKALVQEIERRYGLPSPVISVQQDSVVALEAAFPKASGIVIIVGTGSIVVGRTRSMEVHRAGGWGYLIGDEGSAHSIGIKALSWLARCIDAGEVSEFGQAMLARLATGTRAELIHKVYRESDTIQTVAPLVVEWCEKGNAVATEILSGAADDITECFLRLVDTIPDKIDRQYVLTGGLSESAIYRRMIEAQIGKRRADWTLVEPQQPKPVYGALALARSSVGE